MVIILPWPERVLSPNVQCHWTKKSAAKKLAKERAASLAGNKPERNMVHMFIEFFPPTRRSFDLDNALASMKSSIDGLALAWGIDDKIFNTITITRGPVFPGGKVQISFKD